VDLNYIHRVPLEPIHLLDSKPLGSFVAKGIPTLDVHELAAGKLAALLDRSAPRDIFDASGIFGYPGLDFEKLRITFVVIGAMSRNTDLRDASPEHLKVDEADFQRLVKPLLRSASPDLDLASMVDACRAGLARLLPLRSAEIAFIEALWERGEIHPELLTKDSATRERILVMPMLLWKAKHVRQHKGISVQLETDQIPPS